MCRILLALRFGFGLTITVRNPTCVKGDVFPLAGRTPEPAIRTRHRHDSFRNMVFQTIMCKYLHISNSYILNFNSLQPLSPRVLLFRRAGARRLPLTVYSRYLFYLVLD